jgi:NADPH:quinone reductase-like Zn-dependent oxidoreductase
MTTMKAMHVEQFGGPEVLHYVDLPKPTPGAGDALIEVDAIEFNRNVFADSSGRAAHGRAQASSIINVSSGVGVEGRPRWGASSVSKFGVETLARI